MRRFASRCANIHHQRPEKQKYFLGHHHFAAQNRNVLRAASGQFQGGGPGQTAHDRLKPRFGRRRWHDQKAGGGNPGQDRRGGFICRYGHHSFGRLAEQNRAGLGWVERSVLRKEIADVAFQLKAGQRSGVIETPEAYYIMLVEDRPPLALPRAWAKSAEEIEKTLLVQERAACKEMD